MAVNNAILGELPEGCYRQPTENEGLNENGSRTKTIIVKGGFEKLDTVLKSLSTGCKVIAGWVLSSATLSRQNGAGLLTIICTPDGDVDDDEGNESQQALRETWTLKTVRNDKSILAYCGGDGSPNRALVEAWQKEPDGTLAAAMSFTRSDGTVCNIADLGGAEESEKESGVSQNTATATRELIIKIMNGIDSVMRFYPMLTKTTVYSRPPDSVYENLSTIDTPEFGSAAERIAPGNLSSIIDNHTWVKCQDDYAMNADGTHSRIESWIGSVKGVDAVDVNLYGTNQDRWPMPYKHAGD